MLYISKINLLIGFSLIFCSACFGALLSIDLTQSFLSGLAQDKWLETLKASSHGHSSLFGVIHILIGLTHPYTSLSLKIKKAQFIGMLLGSLAMGPMMIVRANTQPLPGTNDNFGALIGCMLAASLVAVSVQIYGMLVNMHKRH